MARESFLINPPAKRGKKKTKRKTTRKAKKASVGKIGTTHRLLSKVTKKGVLTLVEGSKLGKPGKKINPYGEEVLIMGANPKRKKSRKKSRRRSYKRNPAKALKLGGVNITKTFPLFVTGGISAIASQIAVTTIPTQTPLGKYGVQAGTGFLGSMLVGNMIGKEHGKAWLLASGAIIVADALQTYVLTRIPGLPGVGAFPFEGSVGAFPDELVYGEDELSGSVGNDYPYDEESLIY